MGYLTKIDTIAWTILLITITLIYKFLSDGEYSFLFTLAGTVQTFGFALIIIKIKKTRSVAGLSRQTFICYFVIFLVRSVIYIFTQGYLPVDSTGDSVFRFQQAVATGLSLYIVSEISVTFRTSYNQDYDIIKCYYLILFAGIVAIFFHSNLSGDFLADYGWAFSQYLETIAIMSQLVLFVKKGGQIQIYTTHFIVSQALYRVLSIAFWLQFYVQLHDETEDSTSILPQYVGYWFMITQIVHLLLMGDFLYYWVKGIRRGEGVNLPSNL